MSTPSPPASQAKEKRQPAKKFGRVAVWLNAHGFGITISPRRYWDSGSNGWKDATWDRPSDLPELIFCLQKALEFAYDRELPSPDNDIPQ